MIRTIVGPHPSFPKVHRRLVISDDAPPKPENLAVDQFAGLPENTIAYWDFSKREDRVHVLWVTVRPDLRGRGIFSSLQDLMNEFLDGRQLTHGPILHPAAGVMAKKLK